VPVGARAAVWVVTAGVLGVQLVPWRPPAGALAATATALLVAWGCTRHRPLGWLAVALLAAAASARGLDAVEAPLLPPDHVARLALPLRTTLAGEVEEIRRRTGGRAVVVLQASAVTSAGGSRPVAGRVRLTVRGGLGKLRAGDELRVESTLRAPRNFANPGGFDLVGHLARRDIRVTAAVWDARQLARMPRRTRGVTMRLRRWRERLRRTVARNLPAPQDAVLAALVLGDDDRIAPSLRRAFARAGVVHVLSVSGLHIALVALASFSAVRWLLGRSERVLLACDVRRIAALISLGPVAAYGVLAGLEAATLRSVLMAAVGVLAVLLGRRADVLRMLALAAVAMALAHPAAPRDIGFQLSFVSVLALVLGTRRWAARGPGGPAGRSRTALVVSAAALAGTAPLSALHFQQVSPMSLVANPLVVPLFGSVVVVLGLLGAAIEPASASAAATLFRLAGEILRPGIALVELLARPAWAAFDVPIPSTVELLMLYGLLTACVLPAGRGRRVLAIAAAAGLLVDVAWWVHVRWTPGVLRVTFLDVGQGDAAVAELPDGRVLVVDAGGFPGSDFDTGAAIVAPYLATRKVAHVDALVMTHAHPDHSGGLPSLVRRYRPGEFWWTGWVGRGDAWARLEESLAERAVPQRILRTGAHVTGWGGILEVLHPPENWPAAGLNDTSLTLRLTYGAVRVLLTGDVEAAGESRMLAASGALPATVLKVPHHGSRTSSTPGFVQAVAPRVAVISVGADNRYRLPSPEVEARYRARGTCLLRTDWCGAVTIVSDGRRLDVTTARPECSCRPETSSRGETEGEHAAFALSDDPGSFFSTPTRDEVSGRILMPRR
jgi:competence protein ComEC